MFFEYANSFINSLLFREIENIAKEKLHGKDKTNKSYKRHASF